METNITTTTEAAAAGFMTLQNAMIFCLCLAALWLVVFIMSVVLFTYFKKLSNSIYSYQRDMDHKISVIESVLEQVSRDLPLNEHPAVITKEKKDIIEDMLHDFSAKLHSQITRQLDSAQDIWNDKFSILLSLTGKTEQDLKGARDDYFKDSWTSITELRKKSQLLFNDMQEDGIFYRLQSLWLLSELEIQQGDDAEAFRHCTAAIKLYHDSKPKLPISRKVIWKICETLLKSSQKADHAYQLETLKKFHITAEDINTLYRDTGDYKNSELMQKLGSWSGSFL